MHSPSGLLSNTHGHYNTEVILVGRALGTLRGSADPSYSTATRSPSIGPSASRTVARVEPDRRLLARALGGQDFLRLAQLLARPESRAPPEAAVSRIGRVRSSATTETDAIAARRGSALDDQPPRVPFGITCS